MSRVEAMAPAASGVEISRAGRLSAVHQPGLDGIRGVAILLVLVVHLGVMIPKSPVEHAVFAAMSAGWIGVDLFFVLSGTLITGILLDTKAAPNYFRNFYVRRVLRIFPVYFALLIFSFYILPHIPNPKAANFARIEGDEIWYWLYLQNFAIAIAGSPRHSIMDVTWSLAIEEQFYLVWPLLVYLTGMRRLAAICVGLLAASLALRVLMLHWGYTPFTIYLITPTRIDGLCAGALVAIGMRHPAWARDDLARAGRWALACGGVATAAVAVVSKGLPWDGYWVQTAGFSALAVMFAGLVLLTVLASGAGSALDRFFRNRVLVFFGVLSYGLYLFHLPLRALLRDTIMRPLAFPDWPGGTLAAQMLFYVAATALAVVVAWLSFHLYEKQFLKLKGAFAAHPAPSGTSGARTVSDPGSK